MCAICDDTVPLTEGFFPRDKVFDECITIIQHSLDVHRDWLEFFKKFPGLLELPEYEKLGYQSFHEACIRRYQRVLDVLSYYKKYFMEEPTAI